MHGLTIRLPCWDSFHVSGRVGTHSNGIRLATHLEFKWRHDLFQLSKLTVPSKAQLEGDDVGQGPAEEAPSQFLGVDITSWIHHQQGQGTL